jgi:hypothetical protein
VPPRPPVKAAVVIKPKTEFNVESGNQLVSILEDAGHTGARNKPDYIEGYNKKIC